MNPVLWIHIAGGSVAVLAGFVALSARKGTKVHVRFGRAFAVAMLVLGSTAAVLEPFREPEPGSVFGGLLVVYLIATAWGAARHRTAQARGIVRGGMVFMLACGVVFVASGLVAGAGVDGKLFGVPAAKLLGALPMCVFAAWRDWRFLQVPVPTVDQWRLRHAWRMSLGMFVATGSFFLGQMDVLPEAVRGNWLFLPAFAPLIYLAWWRSWGRRHGARIVADARGGAIAADA